MNGLTKHQVIKMVNRYIGVSGGYLGTFSYRTHSDFYPEYCELDYEPDALEGTTRERFIHILSNAPPSDQAKILKGVVEYYPLGATQAPPSRTPELQAEILGWAANLSGSPAVTSPTLSPDFESTRRHLQDAETLIQSHGAHRAIDRVHTALHEFLRHECNRAGLPLDPKAKLNPAFKILREQHPAFRGKSSGDAEVRKIVRAFGGILEALNDVRNNASPAHPNETLKETEAMLAINAGHTILHYIHAKIARHESGGA
ncbi:MAG: abortive infection family protein [Myxococcota bacterium]